jgi:hypothetical protein
VRHTGLKGRIARLEAKLPRRALWPVFIGTYDHDDAITGYGGFSGAQIDREQGEALEALQTRCTAALAGLAGYARAGPVFCLATYAEPEPLVLPELEAAEPEPPPPTLADLQDSRSGIGIVGKRGLYAPGEHPLQNWLNSQ